MLQRDPAQVQAWRARSKPLRRSLHAVGFVPQVIDGGLTREAKPGPKNPGVPQAAQRTPLRAVSAKRARENRARAAMADRLWPDRREGTVMCGVPWCGDRADDLHEVQSRARGGSIVDDSNTVPLCRAHHDQVTFRPESELVWAYRANLLRHSWDSNGSYPDGAA